MSEENPTIKELIKLAKADLAPGQLPKLDVNITFDEAQRFVIALKIKDGKERVTSGIIYKSYEKWSPNPISKQAFAMQFKLLFTNTRDQTNNYYMLNYKPIELVKEVEKLNRKNEEE